MRPTFSILGLTVAVGLVACGRAADTRDEPKPDGSPAAAAAPAPQGIPETLAAQLRCADRPTMAPVVLEMVKQGYIAPAMDQGADSISCFHVRKPLIVPALDDASATIDVKAICVADEDADLEAYPRLFWRGPGTAPPNLIEVYAVTTTGYEWARANATRYPGEFSNASQGSFVEYKPAENVVLFRCSMS